MRSEGFKRTLSVAYLVTGFAQGCELLFYYLLYKMLSAEQVGLYSWAVATVFFLGVALDLGISPTLVREFSQTQLRLRQVVSAALLTRVPVVVVTLALLQGSLWLSHLPYERYWIVVLAGAAQVVATAETLFSSWLRAHQRQIIVNVIAGIGSLGRLVCGFVLLALLQVESVVYVLAGLLLVRLFTLGATALTAYRGAADIEVVEACPNGGVGVVAWRLLRIGLVFAGISLLTVIQNRLDWLLVSSFVSMVALASYSLANKFYEIFQLLIGVCLTTAYPWICRDSMGESFDIRLSLLLRGLIFMGTMVALVGMLVLPGMVQLLFQDKYEGVGVLIRLLMLAASVITMSGVFYHILVSRRFEKKILPVTLMATGLQVGVDLVLIPRLGGTGAAVGMLTLVLGTGVGLLWLVIREQVLPVSKAVRIALFSVVVPFVVIILLIWTNMPVWSVGLALVAVGMGVGWLVLLDAEERKWLVDLTRRYAVKAVKRRVSARL